MPGHRSLPIRSSCSFLRRLFAGCLLAAACASASSTGDSLSSLTATPQAAPDASPEIPRAALPPPEGNPFLGARLYVDPEYAEKVETHAASLAKPDDAARARKVKAFATAVWLSSIADVARVTPVLDDAKKQEAAGGQPVVPVFVLYDLPNRDCAAKASDGELRAGSDGEARYRTDFIDKIARAFRAHAGQRIAVMVEPDSLANLATNLDVPKCAASERAYRDSIAYAVRALSAPHVALYLDAAHAGWLGWDGNRAKIAQIFKEVLEAAGGADKIRGFFTNVSNYNLLRGVDGKALEPSNPCPDELTYVNKLAETLMWAKLSRKAFIVDTGRGGRGALRGKWGSWCNVHGAGLGERPRAAPAPLVDAYLWVKPPGESDGTSDPSAPRFDAMCGSADAAPGAPQAGKWFSSYFQDLIKYANPPL